MSTHAAHSGIGLSGLRGKRHLPQVSLPARKSGPARPWLERLAAWAERQPRHHHLGSCGRL